jgi:hypothetical protein
MRTLQPKPYDVRFLALVEFTWICPDCATPNRSRRPSRDEYLNAKCGNCHKFFCLDYHRSIDAPPAALALDRLHLGDTRSQPIKPVRRGKKP